MKTARKHDLVIYGSCSAGIACGIRAAREGLSVLLVVHTPHLGGMLTSGLCVWDTQHEGNRAPVYDELRQRIFNHYRITYGADSSQYRLALPGKKGHNNGNFEPKVAREIIEQMVAREQNIEVRRRYFPIEAFRDSGRIQSVRFRKMGGDEQFTARGKVFADCSYEGDLMALSETAYRYGRESRGEFHEPHAGRIFARPAREAPNERQKFLAGERAKLNLRSFDTFMEVIETPDSGIGDNRVQAYNWRTVLSRNPANRETATRPDNYQPEKLRNLEFILADRNELPNGKLRINRPQLIGLQNLYVEGTWEDRQKVMDEHWDALQGTLFYCQNDPGAPAPCREMLREYGWAKDEFADNDYRPYEIYVREARRLEGRHVFTQHDVSLMDEIGRTPIHRDSIAVSEWYVDSHACTDEKIGDSLHEGKIMLHQETFPGQIPYRAILPRDLDNLLIPVCLSSSHAGWNAVRLEPTWMNIGESAGLAAALAVESNIPPAGLNPDLLLRALAGKRIMISFFNDMDVAGEGLWVPAVQYLGANGFFAGYDCGAGEPLDRGVAGLWATGFREFQKGQLNPMELAERIQKAAPRPGAVAEHEFISALGVNRPASGKMITRGEAAVLLFEEMSLTK
ncbi:MAG: FAD-dependent oxidoreductase [Lewinellaceae bacterium]|nr:FAD-dependent oxidoreductase [Phaeodactylibacter sp.]MCB9038941.1 FAD-dependent oxidoreductase [Lewinellaceae bacterium]